ncbi:ABC transporter ATP-binding protein [Plantibacter sp. Mn2098]|uniref:ABC transporter ATP-binding protein n=1 Tax=Plantibacter sp. Mn2098 TaxID=3395266 RepID=UPI003BD191D0
MSINTAFGQAPSADPVERFKEHAFLAEPATVLEFSDVALVRNGRELLSGVDLRVREGEHWAVIGPNGAGKTTLMNLCAAVTHPTRGTATVLGRRIGRTDVNELRRDIGFVQPRHPLTSALPVIDVVLTGATATIERRLRWDPSEQESARAHELVDLLGIGHIVDSPWTTLSQGERGRALIARALMREPQLLLLDEPSTGLDVAARENLLDRIRTLVGATPRLATVTITHHLEELPSTTTHAALIRDGRIIARGLAEDVLTTTGVSAAFDYPIRVSRTGGRWSAVTGVEDTGRPTTA